MAAAPESLDTYYSRTLRGDVARPALQETVETDICVIGGGLAGLACALGLAERGRKAVVLESRRIGFGASGRNGGFVLAGFAADPKSIVAKTGLAHARDLFALTRNAQKTIRRRIAAHNIPCDPVDGHLKVSWFNDPSETQKSVAYVNEMFGMNAELWPREKVRELYSTDKYYEGQFYPDYFHMHPLNYLAGIAAAFEAKGGKIFEDSAALNVARGGSGFTVTTAQGAVRANQVVYCGSAYFNGIEPRLARSCLPVSTYVMVTEPLPRKKLESAIRAPYAVRDNRWADDYYRPLPDGSLLWGGRVGLGRGVPRNLPQEMLRDMLRIYPQLEGAKVACAWAGVMGYTVHKMPHIGKFSEGLWYCTNFGGNGVGPTTAGGEAIAAAIAENDVTYRLFEPFGFQYTGGLLGPFVARAVYCSWELGDRLREFRDARKSMRNAA
jgi:gamma-glutamylputrescine oxidase